MSLANTISLTRDSRNREVTMDMEKEQCFNVHRDDGTIQKFIKSTQGFYYHDIWWNNSATVMLNTVAQIKRYTQLVWLTNPTKLTGFTEWSVVPHNENTWQL